MNFEEMVKRTVNAEAKTGLKSSIMVRNSDIHCLQGHRPSNSTTLKVQTQEITVKNSPHPEKLKAKKTKPIRANASESFELAKKKDK